MSTDSINKKISDIIAMMKHITINLSKALILNGCNDKSKLMQYIRLDFSVQTIPATGIGPAIDSHTKEF